LPPIDICIEAIAAEASFVARSFAGDPAQVRALIKAALSHRGTAVIDIISPCVTFNNHETSTKSYPWCKQHQETLQDITYVPFAEPIMVDYAAGGTLVVEMHDRSHIQLRKLEPGAHDPTNQVAALDMLEVARVEGQFLTGLIYVDESRPAFGEVSHLVDTPLVHLSEDQLRPPREALARVIGELTYC
jgi:2-oxoglutarate ferredoxin oxidoreductase subunit beta